MTKDEIIEEANLRFPKNPMFVHNHYLNVAATNNCYGFIQGASWAQEQIYNRIKEELTPYLKEKE